MKIWKTVIGATLIVAAGSAQAQIPTTDVANIAQNLAQHVETIAKWAKQAQQMQQEYSQQIQQYKSMTGSRGFGMFANNPLLNNYLPNDWQSTYSNIRSQGFSGMTGGAQQIYNNTKIYDRCQGLQATRQTRCQSQSAMPAQNLDFTKKVYSKTMQRMHQIKQLQQGINSTDDPKSIAEMQARLSAEQASIQNEKTKLQMFRSVKVSNQQLHNERVEQEYQKTVNANGTTPHYSVNFNTP